MWGSQQSRPCTSLAAFGMQMTHPNLRNLSKSKIKQEIVGARDAIEACGIPAQDINGFRCPFLADKPEVRQVLYAEGFR